MISHDSNLPIEIALLGFLVHGSRHAYDLNQEFARELGRVWRLGQSLLYAQLKELAELGYLTMDIVIQPNRPARKVYSLTDTGMAVFTQWLNQPTLHMRSIRVEFLVRLYFFRSLGLSGLEELVSKQKALLQDHLEGLEKTILGTKDTYWRLVVDFRLEQTRVVIQWLDRCIQQV